MNFRVTQKILAQCIKRNHYLLTVHQNVNKCGVAYYTVNFHRKNEYNPSCVPFSKHLLQKDLSYIPLYMNFQRRNLSDNDVVKTPSIVKQNAPSPVENTESTLSPDAFLPDFIIDSFTDETILENMIQIPQFLLEFSKSKPVEIIQDFIFTLHQDTGLPWWATFALTAVIIRTFFLLPLGVNQMRMKAKLQRLEEYMTVYKAKLKEEQMEYKRQYGWPQELLDEEYNKKVNNELLGQYKVSKIHPNKVYYLGMIEGFTWVVTSLAIRNICHALPPSVAAVDLYKELCHSGISWFTDLTIPDTTLILPFMFIISSAFITDAYRSFNAMKVETQLKYIMANFIVIIMMPISVCVQNSVLIYWVTNNLYGLLQIYLLHTPTVLRFLRAPPVKFKENYGFYYDLRKANKKPLKQIKAT